MADFRVRAALLITILAAAIATIWWVQSDAPPPPTETESQSREDGPAPETALAPAAKSGAASETTTDEGAERAPDAAQRVAVEADTVVRGVFTAPAGPWPGGGEVQLMEPIELPEGGVMGFATLGMDVGRLRQTQRGEGPQAAQAKAEADAIERRIMNLLGRGTPVARAPVGPDGRFEIADPPAGQFTIKLHHPVLLTATPTPIEVTEATHTDAGTIATQSAAGLRVLVHDADGRPIEGAHVELSRNVTMPVMNPAAMGDMTEFIRNMIPIEAKTDARGTHLFVGLAAEEPWHLTVSATDLADARRPLRLRPGRENLVRVELAAGATLFTRVVDEDGQPCSQARLQLEFPDLVVPSRRPGPAKPLSKRIRTGDDGTVTTHGLPSGRAIVRSRVPGYVRSEAEVTLSLAAARELEVRLERGASIRGRIVDEAGNPLADARVMRIAGEKQSFMGMDFSDFMTDVQSMQANDDGIAVDAEGKFILGGLSPDDRVGLLAVAPGYHHSEQRDIAAGTTDLLLELQPAARLTGIVVSDPDGEPITAFEVSLHKRSFMVLDRAVRKQRFTGATDGSFTMSDLPRQSVRAVVRAEGQADWSKSIDLRSGGVDLGEIRLLRPASIAGRTVDAEGRPVAGASVRVARGGPTDALMMAQMSGAEIVETDAEGRFRLDGLEGSRVRLLADRDGFAPAKSATITLTAGECTDDVVLQLETGGSIHGRLVDGNDQPLAGWHAQAAHTSGMGMRFATTDDNGEFVFEGMAPGPHKVDCMRVETTQGISERAGRDPDNINIGKMMAEVMENLVSERVVVRSGEPSEVTLTYDATDTADPNLATVHGSVRVGGRPLAAGVVVLMDADSGMQMRIAEISDGKFSVDRVRRGTYRARIQAAVFGAALGDSQTVTVAESPTRVDLQLPGGRLRGRVVDASNGAPVAGAVVSLSGGANDNAKLDRMDLGEGAALTDASGEFDLDGLAAGTYDLFAKELFSQRGMGRSARLAAITLGAEEVREGLELRLQRGATLEVAVSDPSGPRTNALVTLLTEGGNPVDLFHRQLTGNSGVATFAQLPPGQFRASVDAPGAAPCLSDAFSLEEGGAASIAITVALGTNVVVALGEQSAAAFAGQHIGYAVSTDTGALLRTGRLWVPPKAATLSLGRFAPGRYGVRITAGGRVWDTVQSVPADGDARWSLP